MASDVLRATLRAARIESWGVIEEIEYGTGQGAPRCAVAVEQQRVLQPEFRTEFELVVQRHFRDQHFDEDHRLLAIESLDHFADLLQIARRRADDNTVGRRFGDDKDFAIDPFEQADRLAGDQLLGNHLTLGVEQVVEGGENIRRICVAKPNHFVGSLLAACLIQSIKEHFDHFQVRCRTRYDDRVGSRIGRDSKRYQRAFAATGQGG